MIYSDLVNVNKARFITRNPRTLILISCSSLDLKPSVLTLYILLFITFLRYLSESTTGLDGSVCRGSHLKDLSSTSTRAVPLSLRLSILHSFETISSISETVFVTGEDSKFASELVQLLRWLLTRGLKIWSFPKSMSSYCCTSFCTFLGPSASCVRTVGESQIHRIYYEVQKFYFLTWLKHRFL